MKKIAVMLLSFAFLCVGSFPCFAVEPEQILISVAHESLANGIECTTYIYAILGNARSSSVQGSVSRNYSYGGKTVASVVLTATFTYDGRTATATSASGTHTTASGWSYAGQSTWCSGATAHLSATVSGSVTIPVNLSLTCSPNGTLS